MSHPAIDAKALEKYGTPVQLSQRSMLLVELANHEKGLKQFERDTRSSHKSTRSKELATRQTAIEGLEAQIRGIEDDIQMRAQSLQQDKGEKNQKRKRTEVGDLFDSSDLSELSESDGEDETGKVSQGYGSGGGSSSKKQAWKQQGGTTPARTQKQGTRPMKRSRRIAKEDPVPVIDDGSDLGWTKEWARE
ncbi:hypothetical protein PM082_015506 [Marasmius tenuissimus]|nr:hypothetical protein PM082_015506 [Marasmius tenuissimus]